VANGDISTLGPRAVPVNDYFWWVVMQFEIYRSSVPNRPVGNYAMKKAELLVREFLNGVPVQAECTVCPFPRVFFAASVLGTVEANQAELDRQFSEHFAKAHSHEDFSQAAEGAERP
jgi:hypothetical protein